MLLNTFLSYSVYYCGVNKTVFAFKPVCKCLFFLKLGKIGHKIFKGSTKAAQLYIVIFNICLHNVNKSLFLRALGLVCQVDFLTGSVKFSKD